MLGAGGDYRGELDVQHEVCSSTGNPRPTTSPQQEMSKGSYPPQGTLKGVLEGGQGLRMKKESRIQLCSLYETRKGTDSRKESSVSSGNTEG